MLPIRDINPHRGSAALTYTIVALNALVFFYELKLPPAELEMFIRAFGVVPRRFAEGDAPYHTILTSMFMHGGWAHILSNMWFLHVFGDNVEAVLGKGRFIVFYLLCGAFAALAQMWVNPDSPIPMVGASGAIAGVLAAYVRMFPNARVLTAVPIVFFITFMEIRAFFFIFYWFGLQFLLGVLNFNRVGGGVAFFAHVGGFVAGFLLIKVLRRPPNDTRGFQRTQQRPWR